MKNVNIINDKCIKIITKFISEKELYKNNKVSHKISMLLHDDIDKCNDIVKNIISYFNIEEILCVDMIDLDIESIISKKDDNKLMVVFLEEIDIYFDNNNEQYKCEKELEMIKLLDGDGNLNNVIFIGTTKKVDVIPDRLKRSGRFDYIIEL